MSKVITNFLGLKELTEEGEAWVTFNSLGIGEFFDFGTNQGRAFDVFFLSLRKVSARKYQEISGVEKPIPHINCMVRKGGK